MYYYKPDLYVKVIPVRKRNLGENGPWKLVEQNISSQSGPETLNS